MVRYFVFRPTEDGCSCEVMSAETLRDKLNKKWWGDARVLNEVPKEDHNYWGNSILIIKGELIVPKAVQTVTEYEIP